MTVGIVVSRADAASVAIGERLRDLRDFERTDDAESAARYRSPGFELREFEAWHLDLEGVAEAFCDPAFVVFASRHSGETGPLLSAHFTGNFGAAEHGGADRELAEACPNAHRTVVEALTAHVPDGYEVGTECTHHGPSAVGAPAMFVELGSGESEWSDPAGAEAVARAILDLAGVEARTPRTVVAFGGGHYVPRPTRIVRETDWAVGHVAADWCLDDLGDPREHTALVERVFEASGATRAVVDGERPRLEAVVTDLGYEVVSETWIRETAGVPLDLAADLEDDLGSVDDSLRFGDPARETDATAFETYGRVEHPDGLWQAARGVDVDAAREAARTHALAFTTEEAGNRVRGRAAFADEAAFEAYVDALVGVLDDAVAAVAREGDVVTVRDERFDPAKAAECGVPEGPAFGRLADGESVDVDGETVAPGEVSSVRNESHPLAQVQTVRRASDARGKGN